MLVQAISIAALAFTGLVAAGDPRQLVNQAQAYGAIPIAIGQKERYDGHKVIRINWHGTERYIKDEIMQAVDVS
jgi:hypothetical protein